MALLERANLLVLVWFSKQPTQVYEKNFSNNLDYLNYRGIKAHQKTSPKPAASYKKFSSIFYNEYHHTIIHLSRVNQRLYNTNQK